MNLLKRFEKRENGNDLAQIMNRRMSEFQDEMQQVFNHAWRAWGIEPWPTFPTLTEATPMIAAAPWPAIDATEDEKAITLRVDVPGMEAKDVEVEVTGDVLTIKGARQEEKELKEKDFVRKERYAGSFTRSMTLPAAAQAEKIEAKYDKGILTVTVPKVPAEPGKKIPVQSA